MQTQPEVEKSMDVVGEYLAAFLAIEQDWGVIDGLMRARRTEEALMYYDTALRHIHKVMEELKHLKVEPKFFHKFDEHSRVVMELLSDESRVRSAVLELVERALSKYPKYYWRLNKETAPEG